MAHARGLEGRQLSLQTRAELHAINCTSAAC
jgi:hypothetical protein